LWIYATKPIAAIVGTALVADVARGAPADIWSAYRSEVGVDEQQFYEYYQDAKEAVAIELSDVRRCAPISIQQLRTLLAGFHPPQVMAKITQNDAENLEAWIRAA
jgi:predicted transcriptional regulator